MIKDKDTKDTHQGSPLKELQNIKRESIAEEKSSSSSNKDPQDDLKVVSLIQQVEAPVVKPDIVEAKTVE